MVDADIPAAIARDAEVTAEIAAHAVAADPHTVYGALAQAETWAALQTFGAGLKLVDQDGTPVGDILLKVLDEIVQVRNAADSAWRNLKLGEILFQTMEAYAAGSNWKTARSTLSTVLLKAWNGSDHEEVARFTSGSGAGTPRIELLLGKLSGPLDANSQKITGLAAATVAGDAVRYEQVMTQSINIIINGGGADITTGVKARIKIDFACTVSAWYLGGDNAANEIVIDLWQDTHANYPPTVADTMITAGTKPTLAGAIKNEDETVDWSVVAIAAGNWLVINVNSVGGTIPQLVTLDLKVVRA